MKKNWILALLIATSLCFIATVSRAELATISESWTAQDVTEINAYSPSASKTYLGQRLLGLLKRETTTYSTLGEKEFDTDDRVILFSTPAGGGIHDATFADGEPGQQVTFVLVTDGGNNVDVTPVTKTGFTSVTLDSAGDTCELTYQDDTVGWVVSGNNSCTVNQ